MHKMLARLNKSLNLVLPSTINLAPLIPVSWSSIKPLLSTVIHTENSSALTKKPSKFSILLSSLKGL